VGATAGPAWYEPGSGVSSVPHQNCFPSLPLPVWDFSCQRSHQFPTDWPFSAGICLGMSPASLDRCRVARVCGLWLISQPRSQFCTSLLCCCLCSHSREHGIKDKCCPVSKRKLGFYPRLYRLVWERMLRAPILLWRMEVVVKWSRWRCLRSPVCHTTDVHASLLPSP